MRENVGFWPLSANLSLNLLQTLCINLLVEFPETTEIWAALPQLWAFGGLEILEIGDSWLFFNGLLVIISLLNFCA